MDCKCCPDNSAMLWMSSMKSYETSRLGQEKAVESNNWIKQRTANPICQHVYMHTNGPILLWYHDEISFRVKPYRIWWYQQYLRCGLSSSFRKLGSYSLIATLSFLSLTCIEVASYSSLLFICSHQKPYTITGNNPLPIISGALSQMAPSGPPK